jgi:hypothetical protein
VTTISIFLPLVVVILDVKAVLWRKRKKSDLCKPSPRQISIPISSGG